MQTIKLTNYEVDIKDALTWGDREEVQNEFKKGVRVSGTVASASKGGNDLPMQIDGSVQLEAKYKLLEVSILEIREGDKKLEFSKEWMNNLSIEDGDKLYEAVDKMSTPKKK